MIINLDNNEIKVNHVKLKKIRKLKFQLYLLTVCRDFKKLC